MSFKSYKDFQLSAINWTSKNYKGKGEWMLIKSPTGTGKTYIGLGILNQMYIDKKTSNPIFLTYTKIASYQAKEKLDTMYHRGIVSLEFARSLKILVINSYEKMFYDYKDQVVVVDESHHLHSEAVFQNMLKGNGNIKCLVGLTGTPKQTYVEDGFKERVFAISREDTGMNFPKLVRETISLKPSEVKELRIKGYHASVDSISELSEVLKDNSPHAYINFIAHELLKRSPKINKAIIFAPFDKGEFSGKLIEKINELCGDQVALPIYNDNDKNHSEILYAFSKGVAKFLVGDKILSEAFDESLVDTLIFTHETSSDIKYSQMVGRAIREREGKDTVHLIDFRSNYDKFHLEVSSEDYLFRGTGYSISEIIYSKKNPVFDFYRPRIDYIELRRAIAEQLEYFGVHLQEGLGSDNQLSPEQVVQFLNLLCYNIEDNKGFVYEYFSKFRPSVEMMQTILSTNTGNLLEVPFVKEIVKPLVELAYGDGVSVLREFQLESGRRIDLMIQADPCCLFEFGMGETSSKKEQILNYSKELKNLGFSVSKLYIIGVCYESSAESRCIGEDIEFINWKDFFYKSLQCNNFLELFAA